MSTKLTTLRSIPLTGYSISTDNAQNFNNYIAGILSSNVTNFNHTISANAFVSRNKLTANDGIKCYGRLEASGLSASSSGIYTSSNLSATRIIVSQADAIRKSHEDGNLQVVGGTQFTNNATTGRLILYGSNAGDNSGYAQLKAQGLSANAYVQADHDVYISGNYRVRMSDGPGNTLAIGLSPQSDSTESHYLQYTGDTVLGNGFSCAGLPTNKNYYDNFFKDLSSQQEQHADYLQEVNNTGWVSLKLECPANMWIQVSTQPSLSNNLTMFVDMRHARSNGEIIAVSFPIAAKQVARLICSAKPTAVLINRFCPAISDINVTYANNTRSSKSTAIQYNSILGDVINDNQLDGISENIYYIDENATEDPSVAQPDKETNNTPNER